jgi:hypothetical protein
VDRLAQQLHQTTAATVLILYFRPLRQLVAVVVAGLMLQPQILMVVMAVLVAAPQLMQAHLELSALERLDKAIMVV